MNREMLAERLQVEIELLLNKGTNTSASELQELIEIASALRTQPSPEFRDQLRDDLKCQSEVISCRQNATLQVLPNSASSLFSEAEQRELRMLPADPRSFFFSFASHAVAVALIASGIWAGRNVMPKPPLVSDLTFAPLPAALRESQGGGSGGDHSNLPPSRGTPPRFSSEQISPPAIVVRNSDARLQVEPTLLGPPEIKLPQSNQIGQILSPNAVIPSNGAGGGGGMGTNSGTGIGPGSGPGYGPGREGGIGTGLYRPGNGVTAPRAIFDPEPEYSDEARRTKFQGNVVLSLIVDASGHPRNIQVVRSVGMGLDEKAIAAVQKWRFAPGKKDGQPVATVVSIEVTFRLY